MQDVSQVSREPSSSCSLPTFTPHASASSAPSYNVLSCAYTGDRGARSGGCQNKEVMNDLSCGCPSPSVGVSVALGYSEFSEPHILGWGRPKIPGAAL